jgi:hypothetical protein
VLVEARVRVRGRRRPAVPVRGHERERSDPEMAVPAWKRIVVHRSPYHPGESDAHWDLRYSATPFSWRIRQTFSGVIGMSMFRTPRCQSASTTAFAIAGGAPTVADSPTPFAPSG